MTREEIFAAYYPICDTVARVLQAASRSISEADFRRAARWLGGEGNTFPAADEADITFATDLALFEPNQRRRRAFERFREKAPDRLSPDEMLVAAEMAKSTFSLFRVGQRHPAAGIWLDDLLHNQRGWLADPSLERVAVDGMVLGLRLFDAGLFHVALGPGVQPAEQEVEEALWLQQTAGRPCFREPLAARLYRLDIQDRLHRASLGISADGRT